MDIKEKLKTELIPLYKELIEVAYDYDRDYILCMQWGKHFPIAKNDGILFVGRATKGWHDPSEKWDKDEVTAENIFNDNFLFARDDQMQWGENHTKKSPFWRIIKGVSTEFYPQEDWFNYIAWSNVCKIAPDNANPNNDSYYEQLESCQKIFAKEIEVLSPKYVVFLTRLDWARDFVVYLNDNKEPEMSRRSIPWSDKYRVDVYQIKNITYIISEHPQGKPETKHKEAIIKIISSK